MRKALYTIHYYADDPKIGCLGKTDFWSLERLAAYVADVDIAAKYDEKKYGTTYYQIHYWTGEGGSEEISHVAMSIIKKLRERIDDLQKQLDQSNRIRNERSMRNFYR